MNASEVLKKLNDVFGNLEFDEPTHTYKVNNIKLTSVTKSIGDYTGKFDAHRMSLLVAKKYNRENPNKAPRTANWYKLHWKKKALEASTRGTRVHLYAEEYPNLPKPSCLQERGVEEFFKKLPSHYVVIASEYRVYSLEYKMAGTIDLLLYNTKTGKLVIADWKTNHSNILQVYNKKKFKKPFNKYYECRYNKFKMQLSKYQLFIEENTEFEVEELWVMWLRGNRECFELDEGKTPDKYLVMKSDGFEERGMHFLFKLNSIATEVKAALEEKKNAPPKLRRKFKGKSIFASKPKRKKK